MSSIPQRVKLEDITSDFKCIYISSDVDRLNEFLKDIPNGILLQSDDANINVILVGSACFMLIDNTADSQYATKQLLNIRYNAHFTSPKIIRLQEPIHGHPHHQKLRWIANMVSLSFIRDVHFGAAEFFD